MVGTFPRPWQQAVFAALLLAGTLACRADAAPAVLADSDPLALGERIYREGILPSGAPLRGLAKPGIVRMGSEAACVSCHRRSGYGTSEGPVVVRPITGPALFQSQPATAANPRIAHQLGIPVRPAYDDRALARAIRDGIDVTGRPLGAYMPRYELSDDELKPLIAYLRALSAQPEPGVGDADIHLATVIQPGTTAKKRQAMLEVMTAFVRDKNAGTRWDEQRRQAGIMRMQRAWRRWHLHVWDLAGTPDTWGRQLEAYYRAQPVFAIVGGLGSADWGPIHDFSERFRVPCIFPQAELPGRSRSRFYTTYLSRGILLEADVVARHLADQTGDRPPAIQVFRRDTLGETAAQELRAALPDAATRLADRVLDAPPDDAFWRRLMQEAGSGPLILWLDAEDLDGAVQQMRAPTAATVYLSPTLLDGLAVAAPLASAGAAPLLVYPWESPASRDAAQARTRAWLKSKGIAAVDDAVQANTFFALTIVGDVLSHILDSFSRDYFIERIEHAVQQSLVRSAFPHVSLGPDQRIAAKGSYVVRVDPERGFTAVSGWIVP